MQTYTLGYNFIYYSIITIFYHYLLLLTYHHLSVEVNNHYLTCVLSCWLAASSAAVIACA